MMWLVRTIFVAVLVSALSAYAFDCFAGSTQDEAMQCCDTMPCPEHNHEGSQDCCQSMFSMHAPFVQPHSLDNASHAPTFFAMLPNPDGLQTLESFSQGSLRINSHAPPIPLTAASRPLRV